MRAYISFLYRRSPKIYEYLRNHGPVATRKKNGACQTSSFTKHWGGNVVYDHATEDTRTDHRPKRRPKCNREEMNDRQRSGTLHYEWCNYRIRLSGSSYSSVVDFSNPPLWWRKDKHWSVGTHFLALRSNTKVGLAGSYTYRASMPGKAPKLHTTPVIYVKEEHSTPLRNRRRKTD